MSALPIWAVLLLSVGAPVSAFVGVVVTAYVTRRAAREADARAQRAEVLRLLRWAAELAVSTEEPSSRLGVEHLRALALTGLPEPTALALIEAALRSTVTAAEDGAVDPRASPRPAAPRTRILGAASKGEQP